MNEIVQVTVWINPNFCDHTGYNGQRSLESDVYTTEQSILYGGKVKSIIGFSLLLNLAIISSSSLAAAYHNHPSRWEAS